MLAYLFAGQGSQFCGMGNNLFDEFPELVAQADDLLGYSIKKLCLEDPAKQLNQTQYAQPAIYIVNALTYYKKLRETNQRADFVAGHDVGEYNALLVAEVFDFATGLQLVKKRAELLSTVTNANTLLSVQQEFLAVLDQIVFAVPAMPVIANVNAEPYHPKVIRTNLAQQIISPVQWAKTLDYLKAQGDMTLVEIA
jgi:polyketide biosynthesis malonyl-CoA-[acyl-carrier-protein] transacylase